MSNYTWAVTYINSQGNSSEITWTIFLKIPPNVPNEKMGHHTRTRDMIGKCYPFMPNHVRYSSLAESKGFNTWRKPDHEVEILEHKESFYI